MLISTVVPRTLPYGLVSSHISLNGPSTKSDTEHTDLHPHLQEAHAAQWHSAPVKGIQAFKKCFIRVAVATDKLAEGVQVKEGFVFVCFIYRQQRHIYSLLCPWLW